MANHRTVCIVGIVFQCILFIVCIAAFCDVNCPEYFNKHHHFYYDDCYGMYTGSGNSGVQACRAFHILGFLACIGAIVTWSLFFANIWDYRDGYISIITLTSAELLFFGLTGICFLLKKLFLLTANSLISHPTFRKITNFKLSSIWVEREVRIKSSFPQQ